MLGALLACHIELCLTIGSTPACHIVFLLCCRLALCHHFKHSFQKKRCLNWNVVSKRVHVWNRNAQASWHEETSKVTQPLRPGPPALDPTVTTVHSLLKPSTGRRHICQMWEFFSRIFTIMYTMSWRQLKRKASGNIWSTSNINGGIKELLLSQVTAFVYCKTDILTSSSNWPFLL